MVKRKKLQRTALKIQSEAEIAKLRPVIDWTIKTQNKEPVCCYEFNYFGNGKKLLGELKIYTECNETSHSCVLAVKSYVKHVRALNGLLGGKSLTSFSKHLTGTKNNPNTVYQIFIFARGYVKHLISAKVLARQKLPKSPKRGEIKNKASFYEKASTNTTSLHSVLDNHMSKIKEYQLQYNIDELSARSLYFMEYSMNQIHDKSLKNLAVALDDMSFVGDVVGRVTQEDITRFQAVEHLNEFPTEHKSRELCVKILYSQFGYILPPSTKWPKGIGDWVKSHWSIRDLKSAFFPDAKCHLHLLAAMLSHKDLWPNVDSVFYYAFMDCVRPAFEEGKVDILLEKKRGGGVDESLPLKDSLVVLLSKYLELFRHRLSASEEGRAVLGQERVSIFTHAFTMRDNRSIKQYDPSSSSDFIRSALAEYAKDNDILSVLNESGITGENFRPTKSVMATLKGVKQSVIKGKLNHVESVTTDGYTNKVETNTLLRDKQKSFQEFIVQQARVSQEEMEQPLDELVNIKAIEDSKRVIFSDINEFSEWIALRDNILIEKDRLSVSNPARWVNHWMVKLAELEGLLSLVDAIDYSKAKVLAESVELPYLD